MDVRRRIVLYGNSLILGTLGASLRHFAQNEVICPLSEPPEPREVAALKPDVILFDLDSPHPLAAFSLLESCPALMLIGISPDSNVVKVWSGKQLRELSTQDLMEVIHEPRKCQQKEENV